MHLVFASLDQVLSLSNIGKPFSVGLYFSMLLFCSESLFMVSKEREE